MIGLVIGTKMEFGSRRAVFQPANQQCKVSHHMHGSGVNNSEHVAVVVALSCLSIAAVPPESPQGHPGSVAVRPVNFLEHVESA